MIFPLAEETDSRKAPTILEICEWIQITLAYALIQPGSSQIVHFKGEKKMFLLWSFQLQNLASQGRIPFRRKHTTFWFHFEDGPEVSEILLIP